MICSFYLRPCAQSADLRSLQLLCQAAVRVTTGVTESGSLFSKPTSSDPATAAGGLGRHTGPGGPVRGGLRRPGQDPRLDCDAQPGPAAGLPTGRVHTRIPPLGYRQPARTRPTPSTRSAFPSGRALMVRPFIVHGNRNDTTPANPTIVQLAAEFTVAAGTAHRAMAQSTQERLIKVTEPSERPSQRTCRHRRHGERALRNLDSVVRDFNMGLLLTEQPSEVAIGFRMFSGACLDSCHGAGDSPSLVMIPAGQWVQWADRVHKKPSELQLRDAT